MRTEHQIGVRAFQHPSALKGGALLQRKCDCGSHSRSCSCTDRDNRQGLLHRSGTGIGTSYAPSIVSEVLRSSGETFDQGTRAHFETRFGHDFSHVRVHSDSRAAESAGAVDALAFTVGNHIVFGPGQYQPGSFQGKKLIAHELSHTIQQSSAQWSSDVPLIVAPPEGPGEREADSAASEIVPGHRVEPASKTGPQIQRAPKEPEKPKVTKTMCPEIKSRDSNEEFRAIACGIKPPAGTPAECEFTPGQLKALKAAQAEGAARVKRAQGRIGVGAEGRKLATELASRLFVADAPKVDDVVRILGKVEPLLSGSSVHYAGRTCADATCKDPGTVAYVTAPGTLPIFICPVAFYEPEELYRKVLHEALHWAGIVVDRRAPEIYCEKFDCQTACGTADIADAWMHYISCLGEPLKLHRSFIPKIIESVNEID
jgi:hypothetical protein